MPRSMADAFCADFLAIDLDHATACRGCGFDADADAEPTFVRFPSGDRELQRCVHATESRELEQRFRSDLFAKKCSQRILVTQIVLLSALRV